MASSTVSFSFDNHPDATYHAERDDSGFVTLSISAGGDQVQIGGFLVTQTPPPPPEPEPEPEP